jgi:hypothetical protein
MALGAMVAHPDLKVQLVPVGLSYFHPHKFRSRAVIEFGAPIVADQSLVDMYKEGGGKKREACGKLLEQVHDGLRAVTLRGPDWETMQVSRVGQSGANYRSFKPPVDYTVFPASTSPSVKSLNSTSDSWKDIFTISTNRRSLSSGHECSPITVCYETWVSPIIKWKEPPTRASSLHYCSSIEPVFFCGGECSRYLVSSFTPQSLS